MTNESTYTEQRSIASNVRASLFGVLNLFLDVVPQNRPGSSNETGLKMLANEPDGLVTVEQRYVSPSGAVYRPHELVRGREVEDDEGNVSWVQVSKEEQAAMKTGGLDQNVIDFKVHPAPEIDATCRVGEKGYRLRPGRTGSGKKKKIAKPDNDLYVIIRELVEQTWDQFRFVGSLRLRDNRQIYMLDLWNDQLMLTELITDTDLAVPDKVTGIVQAEAVAAATMKAETMCEPWDASVHRWDALQALNDLVESKQGDGSEVKVAPVRSNDQSVDFAALLRGELAS